MLFVSCRTEEKPQLAKSNFSIQNDYTELTNKITELDTIKIWVGLSQCLFQGVEKLTITREKDSLKVQPEFAESMVVGAKFKKIKPVFISVNDTTWKFNEFLKRNKNRLNLDSLKYGRLQITYKKKRLNFMTDGLGDNAKFLIDYCKTMKNIMPDSDYHIYTGIEIEDPELITQ
mgnify:CR=1 FL=1